MVICALTRLVCQKSGLSCLVDQVSCHGCPVTCALFLILAQICGREQYNSALAVQLQHKGPFDGASIPQKIMSP